MRIQTVTEFSTSSLSALNASRTSCGSGNFGVTNGVPAFQRTIDDFIVNENLSDTFAYIDDVTICGRDQNEHDKNLKRFLEAAKRKNLTLNESKSTFSTRSLQTLGYIISEGEIKPDPDRLQPLRNLPPPTDKKTQKRVIGLFAYYSQWIQNFSDKSRFTSSDIN